MDFASLQPQIERFVTSIGSLAAGYMIAKGIDQASALAIGGGITAIFLLLWGYIVNKQKNLIAAAATQPGVEKIVVTTPTLANSIPDMKVVAGGGS